MKIIVFGAKGQLGSALRKKAENNHSKTWYFLDKDQADVRNSQVLHAISKNINPEIIVNCAALTEVDQLENQEKEAFAVNAYGAENVANASKSVNAKLIHVSTDYVFDGKGVMEDGKRRPYRETDLPNPLMVYGKSKYLGENLIRQSYSKHVILRTSWLYGGARCFVTKILQQAAKRSEIHVVNDQIGTPTSAEALANAITGIMETDCIGLYHSSCQGETTWYEFACLIMRYAKGKGRVVPVASEYFPQAAPRPKYSVLDNGRLNKLEIYRFGHWKEVAEKQLKHELNGY